MLSRTAALLALVALTKLLAANSADAQQLKMPSDPLAGTVIKSDEPSPSAVQLTPGGANMVPNGGDITMGNGSMSNGAPSSMYSSGAAYNPTLGAHIRATYTTQSYGQEAGQLSLGTMKLFQGTDGMSFIDGQVTMNDESNVGYNLGIGYRWMTLPIFPFSPDAQKIAGVSLWSDGLSKGDGTFFPQIGGSLELLGEHLDLRANGYLPLGEETQTRDFFQTGVLTYSGNNLATQLQGVADTSLTVGEIELAGRIANYDAWVFGGGYGFDGGAFNGGGGKVGLRGYATPDLMVSVAIANDSEFDTNTLVNLTWFIGRTRAENCPRGELSDRFREPVIRNNYVALQQSTVFAAGGPLLDADGTPFSIVHVDSSAAGGGDGTFENPLNSLDNILANSQTGDIVLAHGGSVFSGQSAVLQNEQIFLGEGGNNPFTVTQFGGRMFTLPETAPGALAGPVPQINNPVGAGVTLADDNTVRNLSFSGGANAITTSASGSNNMTLQDLTIANTTGNAINLVSVVAPDADDLDDDDNLTEEVNLLGTVAINNVTFSGNGDHDIFIDGDATGADTTRAEVITITNSRSTGAANESIAISNTTNVTGSSTTITNYDYNGGTTAGGGGILLTNTGSSTTVTESDFTGGDGPAIHADGTIGAVVFGSTNSITNITGNAVVIEENTGTVNVSSGIETDTTITGGAVRIVSNQGAVTIGGSIEANNDESLDILNARAAINVGGVNTGPNGGNTLITNTGTTFTGPAISIVDDGTDAGTSTTVAVTINGDVTNEGGRSLFVDNVNDKIQFVGDITDTGTGIRIEDLKSDGTTAGSAGVTFGQQVTLNVTGANPDGVVSLDNNHADSIVDFIGHDITATTGDAIVSDGGELNVGGTGSGADNRITTLAGQAINITSGFSQSSGGTGAGNGLNFSFIDANAGADAPISIVNYDGTVNLGSTGAANLSRLDSTGTAIVLTDVTTATITNLLVETSTGTAIDIDSVNSTASSVTLNEVTTNSGVATALNATQAVAGGNLSLTINDSTMNGTTTDGLVLDGVDGTVAVNDTTFTGGAGNGVRIVGGDGTFTYDEDVEIAGKTGNSFQVNGGAGAITYNGSITNNAGNSVRLENRTGGSVSFGANSNIDDTGAGIVVANNTGGTHSFLGDTNLTTTTNNAVTLTNNTGSTTTFSDLAIVTTTGAAFTATGGGTVGVSGTTNTISTGTGNGINLTGMTIAAGGVNFDKVDVGTTGNATSAIFLQNNTGGIVSIGNAADTNDGDGGTFNTSGTAVTVTNSSGLTMRNVDINASGATAIDIDSNNNTNTAVLLDNVDTPGNVTVDHTGAGTGSVTFTYTDSTVNGDVTVTHSTTGAGAFNFNNTNLTVNGDVVLNHSGAGTFDFNSTNMNVLTGTMDVNATNGGAFDFFANNLVIDNGLNAGDALNIALAGNVPNADISITGASEFTTGDGSAVELTATGSAKQIRFEMSGATLANSSATNNTYFQDIGGGSTINATLNGNAFDNSNVSGLDFLMNNGATSTTRLALSGNAVDTAGGLVLTNNNAPANFRIRGNDATAVNDDNGGDVTYTGGSANFQFDPSLDVTLPTN
jgi:hypothetical protein